MQQLFVFTAGNKAARVHLDDSINWPVSSTLLDDYLEPDQAQSLKSLLPNPQSFYAWGAVPGPKNMPMWNAMQKGDVVLTVFDNHYHYISSVISKVHSFDLARKIWGTDPKGKTWEYMYILAKPQQLQEPLKITSQPISDYFNKGYRGFTKISDERIANIHRDYGSLEAFLKQEFSVTLPSTTTEVELELKNTEKEIEESIGFDPTNVVDGRKKVIAEIVRRRGQPKFRKALLDAYGGQCAVTGCDVESVLEAAHIISYMGDETNHISNGLLLRADIHTLFDLDELKIDANGTIVIGEKLENTVYGQYQGQKIRFPIEPSKSPDKEAMTKKFTSRI